MVMHAPAATCISQPETNVLSNVYCRKTCKKEAKLSAVRNIYKSIQLQRTSLSAYDLEKQKFRGFQMSKMEKKKNVHHYCKLPLLSHSLA